MDIDTALLRRASLTNLERLARALGVDLGRERRRARRECKAWHWALVVVLARRLRAEARKAAASQYRDGPTQESCVDVIRREVSGIDGSPRDVES